MRRRTFLALAGASAASCALPRPRVATPFDCVIRGATLFDGLGHPGQELDLAVAGDTIAAIGRIDPGQARTRIDARGLALAPGFIDIHTHSDGAILEYPDDESRVFQGVTTEVTGNCGGSAAPGEAWCDVAAYFRALEQRRVATHQVLLVGQGTLRRAVARNENRALTRGELARCEQLLEEALDAGAAGLSTGLEYVPGRYTPTAEIVALARALARRGKLYASHVRNEEAGLCEAIDEALRIGRESGARVEISHLKACGKPNWPRQAQAIASIEAARASGLDVFADAYPYTAYSTGLSIFLDDATREGGADEVLARFADPAQRARIRAGLAPRLASDPGAPELVVIASTSAADKSVVGRDLASIAEQRGLAPEEALLVLLEEARTEVSFVGHAMSEENVRAVLRLPWVMIGSDGYAMAPRGKALEKQPHPRSYGTFARVLQRYVREERVLALPEALHKMCGMPARQLGLAGRGTLALGHKADLVLFDPQKVREESSFATPQRLASGFTHVFVDGQAVIADSRATGARPGRALRL